MNFYEINLAPIDGNAALYAGGAGAIALVAAGSAGLAAQGRGDATIAIAGTGISSRAQFAAGGSSIHITGSATAKSSVSSYGSARIEFGGQWALQAVVTPPAAYSEAPGSRIARAQSNLRRIDVPQDRIAHIADEDRAATINSEERTA